MATTLSSPPLQLPGLRDHQATLNVNKILDTINNLVRILELTLTINLAPPPSPPAPPATVILPKATTLGSGLDQVLPQSASELHSKALTDRIASITKWAKAVTPNPPSTCLVATVECTAFVRVRPCLRARICVCLFLQITSLITF